MAQMRIGRVWSPGRKVYRARMVGTAQVVVDEAEVDAHAPPWIHLRGQGLNGQVSLEEREGFASPEEAFRSLAFQLREQAAGMRQRAETWEGLARKADEEAGKVVVP